MDATLDITPPLARPIHAEELAIRYRFHDWPHYSGERLMLLLSTNATLQDGGEVTLDYLRWGGERGSLLTFYIAPNSSIQPDFMPEEGSSALVEYLPSSFSEQESIIIDIETDGIRAFEDDCELTVPMGIGLEYVAFACSEIRGAWHFISITNLSMVKTFELPAMVGENTGFEPVWIDGEKVLLVEYHGRAACIAEVSNWDPVCKNFDFLLGPISPDGRWFEVRQGREYAPDSMGIISSNCLTLAAEGCFPIVAPAPPGMAPIDSASRNIADAVWLPNSSGLLYIVTVNSDHTTMRSERSEIWHYDLGEKSIDLLYDLPGDFVFGDPWFELAPAPWSPDGSSVVVKDGGSFLLLNVETGVLTPLTEGGVLLGTITLP